MHDPGKHGRDDATQGHKGQVQSTRDGTLLGGPGNIITGFASGIGTMGAGIGIGGVLLVAAPVKGAKDHGPAGGVAGVAVGIAGLGLGIVGGIALGGVKIVQGTFNTPTAIAAIVRQDDLYGKESINLEKVSELKLAEEEKYSSAREKVEHEASVKDMQTDAEYTPTKNVKDTSLYEVLGKPPDASAGELKRAYYKKAMTQHPDKGGDTETFQKLGDAYQVLSDPAKRKKYDTEGLDGLKEVKMGDPAIVFAMLFGESKFDHLTGDLTMVMTMRLEEDMPKASQGQKMEKLKLLQTQREQRLAKILAGRLDTFAADPNGFVKAAVDECFALSHTSLGPQMLLSIGIMYELTAERSLGFSGWIGINDAKATGHMAKNTARALKAAQALQAQAEKEKGGAQEKSPEERAAEEEIMKTNLFNVTALDIESTIGRVAMLTLHDSSVGKAERKSRATALLKLGKIFQGVRVSSVVAAGELVGSEVIVNGLTSKPELNGKKAQCLSHDEGTDRFNVRMLDSGLTVALKRENLKKAAK